MGVMARTAARRAGRDGAPLFLGGLAQTDPGLISRLLSPARVAFDVLEGGDVGLRNLIGAAAGIEGTGRRTWAGPEVTGEDLFQSLIARLPENTPGDWEWRDVPGVATELLVSPWNLLGIGALSKAGKAGARLGRLGAREAALLAQGRRVPRDVTRALAELRAAGVTPKAGRLAEQGALGQRSLFSLDVPFTGINVPLGGRKLNELALGALGAAGRGIRAPLRATVGPLFRVGGRLPTGLNVVRQVGADVQRFGTEEFNELISASEDIARAQRHAGFEQAERTSKFLKELDPAEARRIQQQLRTQLDPLIQHAVGEHSAVQGRSKALQKALQSGDEDKIARTEAALARTIQWVQRRLNVPAGSDLAEARQSLWLMGAERLESVKNLDDLTAKVRTDYAGKLARWQNVLNHALIAGDQTLASRVQGTLTRLQHTLAEKVADLGREQDINRELLGALPAPVMQEIQRYAAVTGRQLRREQIAGVRVSELTDPLLSYVHRTLTVPGLRLSKQLEALGLRDNPFVQYARRFSTEPGFQKRRIKAFEGLGIMQINDLARQEVARLKAAGIDLKFGPQDQFFLEDPGEILLRRFTAGGRAEKAAAIHRGVIGAFAVPKSMAQPGDLSVADYLDKVGLLPSSLRLVKMPPKTPATVERAAIESGMTVFATDRKNWGQVLSVQGDRAKVHFVSREGIHATVDLPVSQLIERGAAKKLERAARVQERVTTLKSAEPQVLPTSKEAINAALQDTRWEGQVIPRDFVAAATKTFRIFDRPEELEQFSNLADRYLAMQRYWVTSAGIRIPGTDKTLPIFPGYHLRNAVSNLFNMSLAGFRNPVYLYRAWNMVRDARKGLLEPQLYGRGSKEFAALQTVRRASAVGALGDTMTSELATVLHQAQGGLSGRMAALNRIVAPAETKTGQRALKFGQDIENNAKLAFFLDGKAKGLTDLEAGERVKQYLFNYSDLSQFEKGYLRRWAFFYTWTRKNLPLMFQQLATNPRQMRLYGMATGQIGGGDAELLPEYQRGRGPIALGRFGGKPTFATLGLPPEDLFLPSAEGRPGWTGIQRIGQKLLAQAGPQVRLPLELLFGKSLSSGQPLMRSVPRTLLGLTPATRLASLAESIGRTGATPLSAARLGGINLLQAERPERQRLRLELQAINQMLDEAVARNRARTFPVYANLPGQRNAQVDALNSRRQQLLQRLQAGY